MQIVSDLDVLNGHRRKLNRPCVSGVLLRVQTFDDRVVDHDLQCKLEGILHACDCDLVKYKMFHQSTCLSQEDLTHNAAGLIHFILTPGAIASMQTS